MIKCGPYRNFNNGWEPMTKEETKELNDKDLYKSLEVEEETNTGDDSVEAENK